MTLQWIITICILLLAGLYVSRKVYGLIRPKRRTTAPADCGHCSQDCSQCPLLLGQQTEE